MQQTDCMGSLISRLATVSRPALSTSPWKDRIDAATCDSMTKLLLRAGIVCNRQYREAALMAQRYYESIDQVIARSFISEEQAEMCSKAMNFIARGIVNEVLAAEGLRVANAKGLTFVEGLKYFGCGW